MKLFRMDKQLTVTDAGIKMSSLEENVLQILNSKGYKSWDESSDELLEVIDKYPGLKASVNTYFVNDGVTKPKRLLSITGTVPIEFEESTCNIPLVVWIPKYYVGKSRKPYTYYTFRRVILDMHLVPSKPETQDRDDIDLLRHCCVDFRGKVDLHQLAVEYEQSHPLCGDRYSSSLTLLEHIDTLVNALCEWPPKPFVPAGPPRPLTFDEGASSSVALTSSDIRMHLEKNQYSNVDKVASDILEATQKFKNVNLFVQQYAYNNGVWEQFLALSGTLLMKSRRSLNTQKKFYQVRQFEVPVCIWLPKNYPESAPEVFFKRERKRPWRPKHYYIDQYGKFQSRYDFWWTNLVEFVDYLNDTVGAKPPVRYTSCEFTSASEESDSESDDSGSGGNDNNVGAPVSKNCERDKAEADQPDVIQTVEIDVAFRLFLCGLKQDGYQDIKEKVLEMLKADRELDKTKHASLLQDLLMRLRDPTFLEEYGNNSKRPETVDEKEGSLGVLETERESATTILPSVSNLSGRSAADDAVTKELQNSAPSHHDGVFMTASCLFCSDPSILKGNIKPSVNNDSNLFQTLRDIWEERNVDTEQLRFPDEILPLCRPCNKLATELQECQELMRKTQLRMDQISTVIEKKVADEFVLAGGQTPTPSSAGKENALIKLRDAMLESYRDKLRVKKQAEKLGAERLEDSHPRVGGDEDKQLVNMGELIVKTEVEEDESAEGDFDDPLFDEEYDIVKIEPEPEEADETSITSEDLNDLAAENGNQPSTSCAVAKKKTAPTSLNVAVALPQDNLRSNPVRKSEGTLMTNGSVKINWTRCSVTNKPFLECRFASCSHSTRFGNSVEEMNARYKAMEQHIQTQHADQLGRQFDERKLIPCLYNKVLKCKLNFADDDSRNKHEVGHRTCENCGRKFGKKLFTQNPAIMKNHKCNLKGVKKRSVEEEQQATSGIKKRKGSS